MKPHWRSSPHSRLRLALLGLSLLLAVLFGLYGWLDRRQLLEQAHEDALFTARQTALSVEGSLDAIRLQLQAMEGLTEILATPQRQATIDRLLRDWQLANPNLMDLLILDGSGRIRHWSGTGTPPVVLDRDYFRAHLANGSTPPPTGIHIGRPEMSRVHLDRWFFALSTATRDSEGRLLQVLVATIDLGRLHQRVVLRSGSGHVQQVLVNTERVIYLRSEEQAQWVGQQVPLPPEARQFSAATRNGVFATTSSIDGQRKIVAFQTVGDFPLYAAASLPEAEVLGPWHERLWIVFGLWLLITLSLLAFGQRLAGAIRRQEQLATTDSLTGLANRRTVLGQAQALLGDPAQAERCGLLMIDVDHFKSFNDTHGHGLGDEVLRQVAGCLAGECREGDKVGRVGGEEFVVLLPDTPHEGCRQVAEHLRQTVEALPLPQGQLSISIGLTLLCGPEDTLERALARADRALYDAKSAGRNCVREQPPPSAA